MEITVSARHMDVSESLRQAATEKIGRLSRFVEGMDRAEVHFFQERNPRISEKEVCEVVLEGHGHHVRCKVAAPDSFAAVDKAVGKLEHQLHKLKTKLTRRYQGQPKGRKKVDSLGALGAVAVPIEPDVDEQDGGAVDGIDGAGEGLRIVKAKRFAMHPMSAEEAVDRMELIGHGFFFFTNIETSRAAVVYRRDDGDVGLIDEAD